MNEQEKNYSSYAYDDLDAARKMRIERTIYVESEKIDISKLTALPLSELLRQREESVAAEQAVFAKLQEQANAWEQQAGNTRVIDKAIEYVRTPEVSHTANVWKNAEYDRHIISNRVYQMQYHIYENTRYDRETKQSVPYSWHLTWGVYTNNNEGHDRAKIAGQDRKVFSDKTTMEKYLNGRIKAYSHLFTEISPPIPQEYAKYFKVNGQLLSGYTIEGEQPQEVNAPQQSAQENRYMDAAEATQTAVSSVTQQPRPVVPIILSTDNPAEKVKEITARLEQGIQAVFDSDRYKEFLSAMSKFHDYSLNNTLLIIMQGGNLVKGYTQWKKDFERHVKKDEKGIKIFAPAPYKVKKLVDKIDAETQLPVLDRSGQPMKEEQEITVPAFKVVSVFDISQTEGKEFPDLSVKPLLADVDQYRDFFAALEKASPVPIAFEQIEGGANGYYSLTDKRIAIKEDVSELQAVKTAIHEIAHAKLHDVDINAPQEEQNRIDRRSREVQAESVAYTVCQHFGLDTSDYSFGYVAGWSSGKEMAELKASLETIQNTAKELITDIEGHFTALQQRENAQEQDSFSIYQLKEGEETRRLRFEPYSKLQEQGLSVDAANYNKVYTAPLAPDLDLNKLYAQFNLAHPADFTGRSLSISDMIVLHQDGQDNAFYVDQHGDFTKVPEFLQEKNTPIFDKLSPEQQQGLTDTVKDNLQMLVEADRRIYGGVTGKTLEAITARGYSYKDSHIEKQPQAFTPEQAMTGEKISTPRGSFSITSLTEEQMQAAGYGFHHASEDGQYRIMGNGIQAFAIAARQRDNPLKHIEDIIEQNDNNFDGIINNTPNAPTVAELEQRAKAGEAISVTDLAKAVKAEKREQPQQKPGKKPSVLKQLNEFKKQAAQQQSKQRTKEKTNDLEV